MPPIKYFVSTKESSRNLREDVSKLRKYIKRILNDKMDGITKHTGVVYEEVKREKDANIVVSLNNQSHINDVCGVSKSSCSVIYTSSSNVPDRIYFSFENWMGESDWEGSLKEYRTYLINHEFLHCRPFYLEHPKRISCKVEKKLPVMYQQSRGIPKSNCKHNPWPLKHEFNK